MSYNPNSSHYVWFRKHQLFLVRWGKFGALRIDCRDRNLKKKEVFEARIY